MSATAEKKRQPWSEEQKQAARDREAARKGGIGAVTDVDRGVPGEDRTTVFEASIINEEPNRYPPALGVLMALQLSLERSGLPQTNFHKVRYHQGTEYAVQFSGDCIQLCVCYDYSKRQFAEEEKRKVETRLSQTVSRSAGATAMLKALEGDPGAIDKVATLKRDSKEFKEQIEADDLRIKELAKVIAGCKPTVYEFPIDFVTSGRLTLCP